MLAHRVGTALTLVAAGGTVIAALLLTPRRGADLPPEHADDGMRLTARTTSQAIVAGEQHVAVSIIAPLKASAARPPLTVAVVIDKSGSMNGEPIENAKAAAARLVGQLDPADAFSIVTYAGANETLFETSRATNDNKAAAIAALGTITAVTTNHGATAPGTCISCGLDGGAASLSRTPIEGGLRRIVLISDGQANLGLGRLPHTRDELVEHAAAIGKRGISITAVGVGLDFDELTMTRIADVGRGNYHFIEDTRHLDAMFTRELRGLSQTVASDAHLVVTAGQGVTIAEAYGYPMTRVGDKVIVPIADLRAGEQRKVVFRTTVQPGRTGAAVIASVELGWRRVPDGAARRATATARAELVTDPARVAATMDPEVAFAVEQAVSARIIEEASVVYEREGAAAAQEVLRRRSEAVRNHPSLAPAARTTLEEAQDEVIQSFSKAPAPKATKVGRQKAYELAK